MSSIKYDTILKCGLYLIALLPLAFTSFTFFPWHYGKTMIFQIIVEVLMILWLVCRMSLRAQRSNPVAIRQTDEMATLSSVARPDSWRAVFRRMLGCLNLLDWSIFVFLAIITITSLAGINPSNSFWGNQARANGVFTWLHFGVFYFLLVWFFRSRAVNANSMPAGTCLPVGMEQEAKQSHSYFLLIVIVAVFTSITSFFPQLLPHSWQASSGGGIIGNRAFLASYLIFAAGVSLYLFADFKNKWRWLFLAAPVLFIYAIIDTSNRGALLGVIAGVFLCLGLCLFFVQNRKIKIFSAVSLIILCFLFLFIFFSRQNLFLQKYFPVATNLANISLSSGTVETRLFAWQSAWQGIKEKPLLGWGWGNYGVVFDKYYNPEFLKHGFTETVWDKPHNGLLEIGVTAGILGIVSYLAILFFAGFYLLRHCEPRSISWRGNPIHSVGKIILFATIVAYFVADLFLFETTNSLILWFLILAFISASSGYHDIAREQGDRSNLGDIRKNWIATACGLSMTVLFIFYFLFLNFRFLKSSYYMRQAELNTVLIEWTRFADKALEDKVPFLSENAVFLAEQFTKFDKAGAIAKEKEVENAALKIIGVLEVASSEYPDNLTFPVWAGQVYLVLGEKFDEKNYQKAEESLLKAEKISPNKQEVLFLIGRLYLLKQDFENALSYQKKAMEVAPEINTSHWFLGLTYVAKGERVKGLEEVEKAIKLGYSLTKEQKLYILDLYALEKNYPKLIEDYKKLIENDPGNLDWYIKLAVVYAESGDKKSALETTRYAVSLFPPLKVEADKFIKKYNLE